MSWASGRSVMASIVMSRPSTWKMSEASLSSCQPWTVSPAVSGTDSTVTANGASLTSRGAPGEHGDPG